MNIRELMQKAKALGADNPKGKPTQKRKNVEDSTASHSHSQSLPPPQSTGEKVSNPDPQAVDESTQPDRKKKKAKVTQKDAKADGGSSSSELPVLSRAIIFDEGFTAEHLAVTTQFYTEEIQTKFLRGEFSLDQCLKDAQVTYLQQVSLLQFIQKDVVSAARKNKQEYDKAMKAFEKASEECMKLQAEKNDLTVQLGTIGKEKKDLEKAKEDLEKKVDVLGQKLLDAEQRRLADLQKQKEERDAEVTELKRKLEASIEGERRMVADIMKYVEKAFDVAIEQIKVRNPAYNLDTRGMSYEYEVIDGPWF
ncbi:putative ankyrin repeat domain-containing protein 18B-like [Sesbania bispinosa]|nr:putative ankyrin repeat domain-containing protein 18B-like [Sesbania bispinosa]